MILIGKEVAVEKSTNAALVGIKGTIIEDTKDTLIVRTAHGEKMLIKGTVTLRFADGAVLDTSKIQGTHASRTKK